MKVDKFETIEKIFDGHETILYRAIKLENSKNVILKFAKSEFAFFRLKNEFEILQNVQVEGVPKVIGLYQNSNYPYLAIADIKGLPLTDYIDKIKKFSFDRIIKIFINLATVLNRIHQENIIHKDIKPANILYQEANDEIAIIDFGISSFFDFKLSEQKNIDLLEGTLNYISPEQTGRINRFIDQRTDLYSLGITFYQLLTGEVPFTSKDSMEIIFFHISRMPEKINHINSSLNEIIFKLLAKNPEDRYQSAYGLIYDLRRILNNEIDFEIATKDYSSRLLLSEKLFGRIKETEALHSLFKKTNLTSEKANYLVIKGDAGQGKSILIEEILRAATLKNNGYFLRGKHDQIHQNIPYSSYYQILKKYTDSVLSEKLSKQNHIKKNILEGLADNAGIITSLVPEMELILGKQPVPYSLEGQEAQNRFNVIMINLLKVMAKTSSPLVLIFDDLQWGDSATLNLIEKMIAEISIPGLLLVLISRNGESDYSESFLNFNKYIDSLDYVKQLELVNLNLAETTDFIKDSIGEDAIELKSLAELIFTTTQGNPFFTREFLKELYSNNAVVFDFSLEKWKFDPRAIQNISLGTNILEFMKNKINSLTPNTIKFLKIASCEGLIFNIKAISSIIKFTEAEIKAISKELLVAGIIYPIDDNLQDNHYSFLHDRILQASYRLNSYEGIQEINFQLGNYYLDNFSEAKIFDICNYFYASFDLFSDENEILNLVKLNYKAILLSKANVAYENGLSYSENSISYLRKIQNIPEELNFSINEEYGWFLYVTGDFKSGEKIYLNLLENCNSLKDFARLNSVRIGQFASQGRIFDSVNLGLEVLKKLGVQIPDSEEERGALFFQEFGKVLQFLETHKVEELLELPKMQDEIQIIIQQILSRLLIPAILSAQLTLLGVLTCISITLVMKNGSIDLVAYAYALFAVTIIGMKQDYKIGIEFGEIAITASQLNNNKALMGGVLNTVGCITNHLKYPAIANEDLFSRGSKYCEESGNTFETLLNQGNALWNKFYRGENLEAVYKYCNEYRNNCKKYSLWDAMINIYFPTMGLVNYLTDKQTDGDLLHYENRSEVEHVKIVEELGSKSPLAQFYGILITKSFFFGNYSEILIYGELLEKNTAAPTVFHDICPNFYRCVAYILLLDTMAEENRVFYAQKIGKLKSDFQTFSELNANNFLHMHLLILAAEASVSTEPWLAMKYFDESISSALENGYIQNAAVANEIAANYYTKESRLKIAETYYYEAYKLYRHWGAELKVKSMETQFPWILKFRSVALNLGSQITLTSSRTATDFQIDYISTVKAADIILREVRTNSLIQKIVQVILENSGANEASLVIKRDKGFIVHSYGKVLDAIVLEFVDKPLEEFENISQSVINYVIHSKKNIILDNASEHPDYTNDNYITTKKVQSVHCQPIFHKGNILGAIYLENNFTARAFNKDRTDIINLIATLAGISIENASLYEKLDEKVKERTNSLNLANSKLIETNSILAKTLSDLKSTQDQLLISEKMVVLGRLIAGIAHEINTPLGAIVASNQIVMDLVSENFLQILEAYAKFSNIEREAWNIFYSNAIRNSDFLNTSLTRKIKRDLSEYLKNKGMKLDSYSIDCLSELGISLDRIEVIIPYLDLDNITDIIEHSLNIFTILNSSKIIKNAATKTSKVISALKNYAHQDQIEKRKMVNIREQIEMCLVLYQNKIKQKMEINLNISGTSSIVAYSDQLNQVWINLINNALFAVQYEGKLNIDGHFQDEFLCISFTDNGPGIPENIQRSIFKPFFTTKAAGDGSGLGLDICKKIVESHNGKIECRSKVGETCFTVYLNRFLLSEED